jgi:hypothetical protein
MTGNGGNIMAGAPGGYAAGWRSTASLSRSFLA